MSLGRGQMLVAVCLGRWMPGPLGCCSWTCTEVQHRSSASPSVHNVRPIRLHLFRRVDDRTARAAANCHLHSASNPLSSCSASAFCLHRQFAASLLYDDPGAIKGTVIGNESVPIQMAQCRFPGLAISIFQC